MSASERFVSLVIAIASLIILIFVFVDMSPPAGFSVFLSSYQKQHLFHDDDRKDTRTDSVAVRNSTFPVIHPRNGSYGSQLKPRSFTVDRIMYNRLPKCASMTVTSVLRRLSRRNNFRLTTSEEYNRGTLPTAGEQVDDKLQGCIVEDTSNTADVGRKFCSSTEEKRAFAKNRMRSVWLKIS